jgi:hypothetical protein
VKPNATVRVTDQFLLTQIALSDQDAKIRLAAVESVENRSLLLQIAEQSGDQIVRDKALEKIIEKDIAAFAPPTKCSLTELKKEIFGLRIFGRDCEQARSVLLNALILCRKESSRARELVRPLINDQSIQVRKPALRLLAVIGDDDAAVDVFERISRSAWPKHELEVAVQTYAELHGKYASAVNHVWALFRDMPSSCDNPKCLKTAFQRALNIRIRGGTFKVTFVPEESRTESSIYNGGSNDGGGTSNSYSVIDREADILIEELS